MPQMLREIGIAGRLDRCHLRGWQFVRSRQHGHGRGSGWQYRKLYAWRKCHL
jgi:hypothetical protein